jgi:hypothetical protein
MKKTKTWAKRNLLLAKITAKKKRKKKQFSFVIPEIALLIINPFGPFKKLFQNLPFLLTLLPPPLELKSHDPI